MKEGLINPSLIKLIVIIVMSSRYLLIGENLQIEKSEVKQALGSQENTKSSKWTPLEKYMTDIEARGGTGI